MRKERGELYKVWEIVPSNSRTEKNFVQRVTSTQSSEYPRERRFIYKVWETVTSNKYWNSNQTRNNGTERPPSGIQHIVLKKGEKQGKEFRVTRAPFLRGDLRMRKKEANYRTLCCLISTGFTTKHETMVPHQVVQPSRSAYCSQRERTREGVLVTYCSRKTRGRSQTLAFQSSSEEKDDTIVHQETSARCWWM
jgi:hypothetical protein